MNFETRTEIKHIQMTRSQSITPHNNWPVRQMQKRDVFFGKTGEDKKTLNPRRCLLTGEIPQVIESNNFFFYCKQQLLTLYYSGENL